MGSKIYKCLTLISFLLLAACGSSNHGFEAGSDETGHSRVVRDSDTDENVKANYTISGSRASFARLANEVKNQTDPQLAQNVLDADAQLVNNKLTVRVSFKRISLSTPKQLTFHATMNPSNGGLRATDVAQDTPGESNFAASIFCPQTDCKRAEIRLENRKQTSKNLVGILVTNATPVIQRVRISAIPYFSSGMRQLEAALPNDKAGSIHGNQKSVTVVEGPSFATVWLSSGPKQIPAFTLFTELFDTSTVISAIKSAAINGKPVRGSLIGNNSSTGDLMVELVDGTESTVLQIEKDKSDLDPEDTNGDESTTSGPSLEPDKAVFSITTKDPRVLAASADFAKYTNHSATKAQILWLLQNSKIQIRGFFTHARNVSPIIGKIFEASHLSPEFAYVLPVESSYLWGGTFNATQVTGEKPNPDNRNPSAFGPWQIVNATAFDIKGRTRENFNLHFIRLKQWDPQDDRGYLVQSTYMASSYMNLLQNLFPQDSALAILAYHAGEGAVDRAQKALIARLRSIEKSDITLDKVYSYKMVAQKSLTYVFRVLAWRDIGQNPTKYGFDKIKPIRNDAYKSRLSRPGAPVPPLLANAHWT